MQKRKITLPDGRYLIFYTFPEADPPKESSPPQHPPADTNKDEDSRDGEGDRQ